MKQQPQAVCGTKPARKRHARNNETCVTCDESKAAAKQARLAPCGTEAAKNRHRRNREQCPTCGPAKRAVQPKAPCGTVSAYKRHRRRKEPVDAECLEAAREHDAARRLARGLTKKTSMSSPELVEEIEFLLKAGEGSHRILTATGYTRNPHSLKDRLRRAGRTDLTERVLRMEDMAA